jgi:hypothetical protein
MRTSAFSKAGIIAVSLTSTVLAQRGATPEASRAAAIVDADEAARFRNDSAAWRRVAPGFVFVHSTGGVDDLAAYQRFRAAGPAASARSGPRRVVTGAPVDILDGNVFVRVRLYADSTPPGIRPGESRVTDVFVRRGDEWHWLAHQTAEVRARWPSVVVDRADVADYAGVYTSAVGVRRTFAMRGDSLVQVTAGAATSERRLVPLSTSSFGYDGLNATVTFIRDRTGRVIGADESAQVGFVHYSRTP